MTPIVRIATAKDAAALARIHQDCFDEKWSEESLRSLLERPGAYALIGGTEAASHSQSFILIQILAGESEILSIATMASARRSGLARRLLREAAAEAWRRNATQMFLEVAQDNTAALSLYTGMGFTPTGRRRSYYRRPGGQAVDALMLRASLPLPGGMG